MQKFIPYLTVIIQFSTIGYLVLTGPAIVQNPVGLVIEMAGVLLGIWAIFVMKVGNFNVTPTVVDGGQLIKAGPYGFIRHPMYTAIIIVTSMMLYFSFSNLRLFVWAILMVDLLYKLSYEEKKLVNHYPGYSEYQKETKRIIPFIY